MRVVQNPFTDRAEVSYQLGSSGRVQCSVYDACGKRVATLFDGVQASGSYTCVWSAAGVAPGMYFVELVTPSGAGTALLVKSR